MADIKRIDLQEPIWEIQFDETITQYRAFALYRDLVGGRSIAKVAQALDREKAAAEPQTGRKPAASKRKPSSRPGQLQDWSAKNRWVERADAYELHLEQQRRQERETEIDRMEQREMTLANVAIAGVMRRVLGYKDPEDEKKDVQQMDWSQLTPGEVAQLAKTFVDISRMATNRPTSMTKNVLSIDRKDYENVVNGLIDIFMRLLPAELRAVAAERASALLAKGGT